MLKTSLIYLVGAAALMATDMPSPDAVFQKHIEATGGISHYAKVKTMVSRGAVEIVGQGIKGTITVTGAMPDKMVTVMNLPGIGTIRTGATAGVAWEESTMQGARLLDGEEKEQLLRTSKLDAVVDWRATYGEVTVEGEDAVDGKACWKLLAHPPKTSKTETMWFDKESGLLTKTAMTAVTPMGGVPVESRYLDYKETGGIKVAHHLVQSIGPQKIDTVLSEVKVNEALKGTEFDAPAELVKK